MLKSYFQNMSVGMTKDAYFEMCDALGSEPLPEEIPIELDDFPIEVQQSIAVYYKLRDEWDNFNGVYLGKSYAGFTDIIDILEVPKEDRKNLLEWLNIMDTTRKKVFQDSKPKKPEAS